MEPIHEKQQQLLGVLLVITGKLLVDLPDGDLEVPGADALVQAGPQGFHYHPELFCHLPFMAEDVGPGEGKAKDVEYPQEPGVCLGSHLTLPDRLMSSM